MFVEKQMLEYNRIDLFKIIDVKKTGGLRRCINCHYWYFRYIFFRFDSKVSYGCHYLMQKAVCFNVAATVSFKGNDYRIHFFAYK